MTYVNPEDPQKADRPQLSKVLHELDKQLFEAACLIQDEPTQDLEVNAKLRHRLLKIASEIQTYRSKLPSDLK